MGIKLWWKSTTPRARFYSAVGMFVLTLVGISAISSAIDSYRFNRLPVTEQERIRQETARINAESTREFLQRSAAEHEEELRRTALAREEARLAAVREAELDEHKANVRACIEAATKLLPGLWTSDDVKSRIEADCAEREARRSE